MIDSERLSVIFTDCLFRDEEIVDGQPTTEPVVVEGITLRIGFHKERLESHRTEVRAMLDQLPETFHEETGGGWSFLNACDTRDGEQWTGLHSQMEKLFALGMGLGIVECQMPREMWGILPGGMPYYVVKSAA